MPSYPLPGYLEHPADLAGNLIAGFHAGAAISAEGSRLAAEAQRTGIEMAERQQQLQAEQARQSQQLQMTRAYHEAQIGLRRAALDQAQQKIQLSTAQTAHKLAEQQGYRQRFGQLTSGPNAMESGAASRQAMLEHPGMFSSAAGLAQAAKPPPQPPKFYPANPQTGEPARYVEPATGVVKIVPSRGREDQISPTSRLHALQNEAKGIQGDIADLKVAKKPTAEQKAQIAAKQKELQGIQDDIKQMLQRKSAPAGGGGIPAKSLPAKKSDLVVGDTYQTKHGPATWNGTKFNPVTVPDFTEEEDASTE